MALYPTLNEVPYVNIGGAPEQKILFSNFEDLGKEQRKRKWLFPKRRITLTYNNLQITDLRELIQFWQDMDGSFFTFTFIMEYAELYEGEYVATTDGSNTVFDLPGKNTSSRELMLDGNVLSEAADATSVGEYYINVDGGEDGVDSAVFFSAPQLGGRLTLNFYGRLAVICRFDNDIEYEVNNWRFKKNNAIAVLKGLLFDE